MKCVIEMADGDNGDVAIKITFDPKLEKVTPLTPVIQIAEDFVKMVRGHEMTEKVVDGDPNAEPQKEVPT